MASYRDSMVEYGQLLRSPKLDLSMFDLNPPDPKQLFQDWSVLHCVSRLFCGLSFLVVLAISELNNFDIPGAISFLIVALGVSMYAFLLSHLPWHCVVKRSGCCGPGYILWGLVYLLGSVFMLEKWYHLLLMGGRIILTGDGMEPRHHFSTSLALGPFLFGIADLFMFIACFQASQRARARETLAAPLLDS
ncbi:tenA [Symbiodinium natans]|uniref:TenA protein n=1 Tax=Symbiodinium natans TaxID=878477 RepID=A0A812UAA3_9DINO|nr:tenA [Symbiodinium natans]